jgi:hypothetical protein
MNPYLSGRLVDERQSDIRRLAAGHRVERTSPVPAGRSTDAAMTAHDPMVRTRTTAPNHAVEGSSKRPRPGERIGGLRIRLGARLGGTVPSGLSAPGRAASAR